MAAVSRLNKELRDARASSDPEIQLNTVDNDLFKWRAVIKGPVDTPFLAGGLAHGGDGKNEGWFHTTPMGVEIAKTIPMGRIGMPQDVVGPTLFLLGDAARYMTGQTLFVNGGRYMP